MHRITIFVGICVMLAACSGGSSNLLTFPQNSGGPDEFLIVPSRPLQTPPSLAALPPPTPGWANRADPRPNSDAIAALGGNPAVLTRRSTDGELVSYASRFGVESNIRTSLAIADREFRRKNRGRLLERWANRNVYFKAYKRQSLNQHRELERFRAAGVRTPSAPPLLIEP